MLHAAVAVCTCKQVLHFIAELCCMVLHQLFLGHSLSHLFLHHVVHGCAGLRTAGAGHASACACRHTRSVCSSVQSLHIDSLRSRQLGRLELLHWNCWADWCAACPARAGVNIVLYGLYLLALIVCTTSRTRGESAYCFWVVRFVGYAWNWPAELGGAKCWLCTVRGSFLSLRL